jgi:soluble lytic murein transglycosylase-like protein
MMENTVKQAAIDHLPADYDWRLYWAQLNQESRFNPLAVSPAGAMGVAQFMPATWAEIGSGDPFNAFDSIDAGARYMAKLIGKWKSPRPAMDRYCLAMASYNAGFGNILKAQRAAGGANDYKSIIAALPQITGAKHSWETISYVRLILGFYAEAITG